MKRLHSTVKHHLVYFLVFPLFLAIGAIFNALCGVSCPFFAVFGLPCPTCGVSRAILALCHFDVQSYLFFHPLALPLLVSVWLMLHMRLFKRKRPLLVFCLSTVGVNTVFYFWHLIPILQSL